MIAWVAPKELRPNVAETLVSTELITDADERQRQYPTSSEQFTLRYIFLSPSPLASAYFRPSSCCRYCRLPIYTVWIWQITKNPFFFLRFRNNCLICLFFFFRFLPPRSHLFLSLKMSLICTEGIKKRPL